MGLCLGGIYYNR